MSSTRSSLRDPLAILRAQVEELKARLLSQREAHRKQIAILQTKLAGSRNSSVRVDERDIDPLAHNTPQGMDDFFREVEQEDVYSAYGNAIRRLLADHDVALDGKHVLDFGVGPGIALKRILEGSSPLRVLGFDFSEKALARARALLPEARMQNVDIYEGTDDVVDLVLCTEVLEHLKEPECALATLVRMLRSGGILFLATPDGRTDCSKYHINFWSPESWEFFLRRNLNHFDILTGVFRVSEGRPYQHNYALCKRRS